MIQYGKLKIGTDKEKLARIEAEKEEALAEAEVDLEEQKMWAAQMSHEREECDRIKGLKLSGDQVDDTETIQTLIENLCAKGFESRGSSAGSYNLPHEVYAACKSKLAAIFSVEENKQKFRQQYIKFLEIQALLKIKNMRNDSYDKYGEVSFDNYGKAKKKVREEVKKLLQNESGDEYSQPAAKEKVKVSIPTGPQKFWIDWGMGKKIGYVILNLYTFCIPVIIHVIAFFVQRALNKSDNKTAGTENQ